MFDWTYVTTTINDILQAFTSVNRCIICSRTLIVQISFLHHDYIWSCGMIYIYERIMLKRVLVVILCYPLWCWDRDIVKAMERLWLRCKAPGARFNKKKPGLSSSGNSHYRSSEEFLIFMMGNPYIGKMAFLYWDTPRTTAAMILTMCLLWDDLKNLRRLSIDARRENKFIVFVFL